MRTNWASGDKVTAADFNEISTMLTRHDTTVDAHDGALSSQANAISAAATAAQEAKDAAAAAATAAQEAKDAAASGGGGGGTVTTEHISPTPPTPAKQAGFVRRTFFDDFDSLATIDTGKTNAPGFNWYLRRPFTGWTNPANLTIEQHADSAGVTESALKILLTGSEWNEAIWSVCTEPGYDSGFSQQYGYFEARICFPDSAVAPDGTQLPDITNKGCPAWWTMGRRHVTYRDLKDVNGSAAASWFELDILEYMDNLSQDSNVGNKMVGSVHDWRRADRTIHNADQGLHNGSDNNSPDRIGDTAEWHNYGCLWTPGMVRWYLDGKPQHFLRYSNGMAPEPNGNSLPTGTFAIADADTAGVALCLGSGLNYPMWVSKVQVWG